MARASETSKIEVTFSLRDRRLLERLAKAVEELSSEQKGRHIIHRDAETGRITTEEYAKANPSTTVTERE